MDIAQAPEPDQSDTAPLSAMADAGEAPLILRSDYAPFAWLVPTTRLDFDLGLTRTRISATLSVTRNPAADPEAPPTIRLDGDGIQAQSVMLDGAPINNWHMEGDAMVIPLPGEAHDITIVTEINPQANTQLMGLYASGGMLCTQCEAEGFRRISFFPDRPDVLSTYTVRMTGPKAQFPILLSNGNLVAEGACESADKGVCEGGSGSVGTGEGEAGRHWAEWHDPWPKPSYLFALVAGDLSENSGTFTTMGGRDVTLNIWVREGDLPRTDHALQSLIRSMRWDEERFGREYDLDVFNIVAVSDFNMGAMENKGLNVFNTKYVLADEESATDADYDAVEGVIAHEYFHNWSGNRVTCQDWFQLSLKEGFTVLRDQLFSQDMQGEAVKRIEDVRILRSAQFPEDSGPLAHPIRPDSFREISNFYTATIYNKGAEIIRMMRSMAGPEAFRKGCDLYFERHDGEAATCEDFITAIEDGAGLDLVQFRRWYAQAGTPKVTVKWTHQDNTARLTLRQHVPDTPGQTDKQPMVIPLKIAMLDRSSRAVSAEQMIVMTKAEEHFDFSGFASAPVLSINRGFTAPVALEIERSEADLVFLAECDDDSFARYEAMQALVSGHIVEACSGSLCDTSNGANSEAAIDPDSGAANEASSVASSVASSNASTRVFSDDARAAGRAAIGDALCAIIEDPHIDDSMRGELMSLPSQTYLAEQMALSDPLVIHREREGLKAWLAHRCAAPLSMLYDRAHAIPFGDDRADHPARGGRRVKTQALNFIAAGDTQNAATLAQAQYDAADNMTDRQGALMVLSGLDCPERSACLLDYYQRYRDNPLVVDKWFAIQATSLHRNVLEHVKALAEHPDFTLRNPNRVRALYMSFAGNPHGFHGHQGEGYRMIADLILELDQINSQAAARFVPALGRWRRMAAPYSQAMRTQLERISGAKGLSRDVFEQVGRSLG